MKNVFMSSLKKIKTKFDSILHHKSNQALDLINNFTIRRRLICFFLLVSLAPIVIIGTISYMSSKGAIESKISKYSQKGLSQTSLNLEMKMQAIENISTQYSTSAKANDVIKDFNNAKDVPELFIKTRPVTDLLQTSVIANKDIYNALLISPSDPTRHIISGSITSTSNAFIEGLTKTPFYKQILAKKGKAVWSSIKLTKDQYLIAIGRKIIAPLSGEDLGVCIIFLDEKSVSKIVNNSNDSEEGQSIRDNFTMIIDQRGFILSSPFAEDLGKSVTNLIDNPQKLQPLLTSNKDTDDFLCKIKNQNVLVTGRIIGDTGWYILNIAKTSYLYQETTAVGWITFIFGIIFGIIAIIISIYIALSISIPLNQVVYSMQLAENGDFTVRGNIKRKDELGYLGASFDHMIEKIGDLLKDTKDAINVVLQNSNVLEDSSHQSAKTAEAVAAAMGEISKGIMEQTTEAEKSSNKMNDLAQQIEVVVTKASEVERISVSTRELSLRSKDAVEQLIHKTNETDQITETIVRDIVDLNSSASEIRDITEVITGISEQTNLSWR